MEDKIALPKKFVSFDDLISLKAVFETELNKGST